MNYLYGKFNWNSAKHSLLEHDTNKYDDGNVDLHAKRISNFNFDNKAIHFNSDTKILCGIIGYISNLEQIKSENSIDRENDVEIIENLYSQKKLEFISDLDGIFTVFVFDKDTQKAYIFQDEYGSNQPIYYSKGEKEFVFSTSLKLLLINTGIKRELNIPAVHDFLFHQYVIPNESTLIKKVFKLVPSKYISIDTKAHSISIESINRRVKIVSKTIAKKRLIWSIENNISILFNQLNRNNIALALSTGFDTNIILHLLRKITTASLKIVTIGGKELNEIPQTKIILENYNNISHISNVIKEDIINSFPDIVWRIEGYVYSPAMFLQYELANLLNKEKCTSIFLGECADQQLDFYSRSGSRRIIERMKQFVKKSFIGDLFFLAKKRELERFLNQFGRFFVKVDYDVMFDVIIKKNGIMLNSFGMQGLYPFLNRDTKIMSIALGKLNYKKGFYKEKVCEAVQPKIVTYLNKEFGTTDIGYLFSSNQKIIMKVLESGVIKEILNKSQIDKINVKPEFYSFLLQLLYLHLFYELFISGKHDSRFHNDNMNLPLNNFA